MARKALSISISSFGNAPPVHEEPYLATLPAMPFAPSISGALHDALERLNYQIVVPPEPIAASRIDQIVLEEIDCLQPDDVLIVHVLSHGYVSKRGSLQIVGSDGEATAVENWLGRILDAERKPKPMTLFLLDVCSAGAAARERWDLWEDAEQRRAWVIAACAPQQDAYGGFFTQAVATVMSSLADGYLDVDSNVAFAPLSMVAQSISRAVREITVRDNRLDQKVTATYVDISVELPVLPFFPNPTFVDNPRRKIRSHLDRALAPFLDDLDEALDPVHFVGRAEGQVSIDSQSVVGCFSGRGRELRVLAPWMNLQDDLGLRVVTGSPGVGKSALLGVLVCAAHPVLRLHTRAVWEHIEQAPYACPLFAAVHARQRNLEQIVGSIARQLRLAPEVESAEGLLEALRASSGVPVIVVDALDEAVEATTIMAKLLLPISELATESGASARLLVGMRPWSEFNELRQAAMNAGGLVDLDEVSSDRQRRDVEQYVSRLLLTDQRWDTIRSVGSAHTLARSVAETLTAGGPHREWGAFLVAGLFTNHILHAYRDALEDPAAAERLGIRVPNTLPDLLNLDLAARPNELLRPVMQALAFARGDGMPADQVRLILSYVATITPPTARDLLRALNDVGFYLRHAEGPDGVTQYRLFHQGLADHLRNELQDGEAIVFESLLMSVGRRRDPGVRFLHYLVRRWDLATPYVRENVHNHAIDAGLADELLTDVGFLLQASADEVRQLSAASRSTGIFLAANLRLSAASYDPTTTASRDSLRETIGRAALLRDELELAEACGLSAPPRKVAVQTIPNMDTASQSFQNVDEASQSGQDIGNQSYDYCGLCLDSGRLGPRPCPKHGR